MTLSINQTTITNATARPTNHHTCFEVAVPATITASSPRMGMKKMAT